MDPASQFSFNTRHGGRNGSQSTKNDRQLPESSSTSFNHPRQNNHSSVCISQPRQSFPNRHNSTPSEQRSADLSVQFQKPVALHFDYHSRYPSPPTTQRSPNSLSSSPPLHPSPNLHRSNGSSSSSAGSSNLSMITLPPLSAVAHHPHPHPHRGVVDHSPNHQQQQQQQVDLSSLPAIQRKPPSITQLPRNHHPEQGAALRRHTLDSGYVPPDPQLVSGGRKRTLSTLPSPITHHSTGSQQQQVPQPLPPPLPPQQQQGQTNNKLTTRRYPSPPPTSNSRRENPPSLAMSPSPILPLQISQSSLDASSSPITSADEAADLALEPLRLGFENIWSDTVQNVRHIMGKMQNDLSRLNATENRKNVNLMRCLVGTSEKLKSQEWAVEELKKENGLLVKKAVEDEQMRRGESGQQRGMVDGLRRENGELRRENEELRRKNEECKEGLRKAAEFIFQYKEELRKVRADAEMLRKCREAGVISSSTNNNHQTTPVPAPPPPPPPAAAANTDLHREITRLHAEKERERIFNDAVKQLRALTALEESPTRERDSEEEMEIDDVKTAFITKADSDNRLSSGSSSSLEVSTTLKQNSTTPLPVCIIDERQPRLQSANQAQVVSTDKDSDSEGKCKVEDVDHEMDVEMNGGDDDVRIVPPITTNPNPDADAEQQTHDSRIFKEEEHESPPQSDLEMQRQRQRQALRGPPPTALCSLNSSPQAHSRKTSQTGVKRDREEYEEGQVDDDDDGEDRGRDRGRDRDVLGSDEPGIILEEEEEKSKESLMHGSSTGMQAMVADADADDDNCSEGEQEQKEEQEQEQEQQEEEEEEIVILERREVKDDNNNMPKKRQKDVKKDFRSDGGRQQVIIVPQTGIKKKSIAATATVGKGQTNAKTLSAGKRSHYRDAPPISLTSLTRRSFVTTATSPYQSIIPPPPLLLRSSPQPQPQPRLQKKLGISHMDLLYKTEREVMVCRFCLSLEQNVEATATTAERRKLKANTQKFPLNASWADLINHCQTEHTKACEDMEKLSPSQLAEMKQRTR